MTETNGIQQLAVMMLNPQFAAQQQKFALQQQMAQQMMQEGNQQPPDNQLANPGGQVVQNSPWAALAHAAEKGVGGYMAGKAIGDNLASYQDAANQQAQNATPLGSSTNAAIGQEGGMGPATAQDVAGQYAQKLASGMGTDNGDAASKLDALIYGDKYGTAEFEQAHKLGNIQAQEAEAAKYKMVQLADQTQVPLMSLLPKGSQISQPLSPAVAALQQGMANQNGQQVSPAITQKNLPTAPQGSMPPPPTVVNGQPQAPANMDDLLNQQTGNQTNVMPNVIPGTTPGVPAVNPNSPEGAANAAGLKTGAEDIGKNLAEAQKTYNVATSNLPRALARFQEVRDAAQNASYGTGIDEDGEGNGPNFARSAVGQIIEPKTANANQTVQTAMKQGIISEMGPMLAGMKPNKFMEGIVTGATGLNPKDPPATKVNTVNQLQDQFVAGIKASAAQQRAYGAKNVPTDAQIDQMVNKSYPSKVINNVTYHNIKGVWHKDDAGN